MWMIFVKKHWKALAVAAGLLLAVVVVFRLDRWIRDRWSDHQYNKTVAELNDARGKAAAQAADIERLRGEIRALKDQAALQQQEALAFKELAERKGGESAVIAKKTEEAFNEYEKRVQDIAAHGTDFDLCLRVTCPTRADAGFPCRPSAEAYCQQFSREPRVP